jgi:MSHA biogenesis protein MshO
MMFRRLPARPAGFTLIEMVMVIALTGIIAAVAAKFIVKPVEGYMDSARRAEMTDIADTALRRMSRDIHLALPNSVRLSGNQALEFLSTRSGGRYRVGQNATNTAQILDFNQTVVDPTFEVFGPPMLFEATTPENQNEIVIYNLGIPKADAYEPSNTATSVRRKYKNGAGSVNNITIVSAAPFPFDSPAHRFQIVDTPVMYVCDTSANARTLTRYWGYPIEPSMLPPASLPPTTLRAVLATDVSACNFQYTAISQRNALVSMQLSIIGGKETVTLYHEVHVSNVP